ncbi:hypothetical protein AB0C88_18010 [Streptomyces chartreusis]|uniref:hypothetical protein n=1 Tax=Streptomyces chartreusis TaxID=1969 RepID=UPI0033D755F5
MPATLVAPHAPTTVLVEELSAADRVVALYASDMPSRYRLQGPADPNVLGWIAQGATRLGREETWRRASYLLGHRKLSMRAMTTPEIDRRHKERFPSTRRLDLMESMAATSLLWVRPVPATRNHPAVIDGPCPKCDGAGKLWAIWVIDADADWTEEGYGPCWVCQPEGGAA